MKKVSLDWGGEGEGSIFIIAGGKGDDECGGKTATSSMGTILSHGWGGRAEVHRQTGKRASVFNGKKKNIRDKRGKIRTY